MSYVTDIKTETFIHKIKAWECIEGQWIPYINDGNTLVRPLDHEIYSKGYKIINKLFENEYT